MDLEDELTRLFQDERLDVRAAADAEQTVVAGARRVRRRRVALVSAAGVLSVLALATGAVFLIRPTPTSTQVGDPPLPITSATPSPAPPSTDLSITVVPTASPPAPGLGPVTEKPPRSPASLPSTRQTTRDSQPPVAMPTVLGPNGLGSFVLGMSEGDLVATGQVTPTRTTDSCVEYSMSGRSDVTFSVSKKNGLAAITVRGGIRTAEGIGTGATEDQISAKYPGYSNGIAPVPGNSAARFKFGLSTAAPAKAVSIELVQGTDCG